MAKHSSTFTGSETAANLNSANAKTVTVKAKWKSNCNDGISSVGESKTFSYTGSVQTFNACAGRTYKLEVWGAQGGGSSSSGGRGGYAAGEYTTKSNTSFYIYVGGQGVTYGSNGKKYGGWNGGGGAHYISTQDSAESQSGTGGGATDISTVNSSVTLNTTSFRYERTEASYNGRIIVAGGGGGKTVHANGGEGGGSSGGSTLGGTQSSAGNNSHDGYECSNINSNDTNYSSLGAIKSGGKGVGASIRSGNGWCCSAPGGGGYYGGGASMWYSNIPAGGGSGYVGGVSNASMSNGQRSGNGQAKITWQS